MLEHIWLFAGYAGSGKDTAAQLLVHLLGESQATIGSFAGAVKDEVATLCAIPRHLLDSQEGKARIHVSGMTYRQLLIQHAEEEKKRTQNPAIWAMRVQAPPTTHWVLSDWRFLDELLHIRFRFPKAAIHTVRIMRPSVHPSNSYTEHELDTAMFDTILDNSGSLLHLSTQIQMMLERLKIPFLFELNTSKENN